MRLGDIAKERRETCKGDKRGIRLIGLEHLISGELRFADFEVDTENTFSKVFHKGDILFGRRRAYLKKAAIAEFDGICSGDITVIQAIPSKIYPDLLPFIIQNDSLFDFAVSRSAGGLSPRVKWEHLADYEFELPRIDEQRVLADKLWAAYNLKEAYKKMIAATDEMVKSQFIEMFGNNGYESLPLSEVALDSFAGGDKPKDFRMVKDAEYKYPVFSNGIGDNDLLCFSKQYRVSQPSVTISARGTIGYTCIREAFYTPVVRLIAIIPNKKVNLTFLWYALIMTKFDNTGAVQGQLTLPTFNSTKIVVPPMDLQLQFERLSKQADKSKSELRQAIDKIDKVIKSLLQ